MWVLFLRQPNSMVRKTELYISCLPVGSLDLGTVQDAGSIVGMSSFPFCLEAGALQGRKGLQGTNHHVYFPALGESLGKVMRVSWVTFEEGAPEFSLDDFT